MDPVLPPTLGRTRQCPALPAPSHALPGSGREVGDSRGHPQPAAQAQLISVGVFVGREKSRLQPHHSHPEAEAGPWGPW